MEDILDVPHRAPGDIDVCEVAFHELDLRQMRKILTLAGNEAVDDPDSLAAANKLLAHVRSDEPGAAGDEIVSHVRSYCGKPARDEPGMIFKAFPKYSFLSTSSGSAIPYSFQNAW
jgi:hypothetical protein